MTGAKHSASAAADREFFPMPRDGAYPCGYGCGGSSRLPGICEACATEERQAAFDAELRPALRSIPARFAWAVPGGDELAERLKNERIQGWARVRRELMAAFDAGKNVVILGPEPQVGKTSAACVVLRHVIQRGTFDALPAEVRAALVGNAAPSRPLAKTGAPRRPVHVEIALPEQVRIARGARFVPARALRGDSVAAEAAREVATAATVLVLDDVGDELDSAPEGSGWIPDRVAGTREVIDYRHKEPRLRTIVTTWLSEERMAAYYGGGTAKRVYGQAAVVKVGTHKVV
ncbi:hypothetical protein [Polyangium jinanense]|uniref:Uncharacterized protein n=1 Tax=Polyangium jinanense TaxID=2829994 RepID=A0A9X3X3P5_9BACT|nr:hypothetical protein [Polyangium jinanense]MDC3983129.1 hypothetical protein [Polyangium jinanense]